MNPNNGNDTKSWDIIKSHITFHWCRVLIYFSDFCYWNLSIYLEKWAEQLKRNKIKQGIYNSDSVFQSGTSFK